MQNVPVQGDGRSDLLHMSRSLRRQVFEHLAFLLSLLLGLCERANMDLGQPAIDLCLISNPTFLGSNPFVNDESYRSEYSAQSKPGWDVGFPGVKQRRPEDPDAAHD